MTKEEMKRKFDGLYGYMAVSGDTRKMMLFGEVMKQMMQWMTDNKPEMAEKYLETLCAVRWRQYLTKDEATDIVADMVPSGAWNYDVWAEAMKKLGLECEREPLYNRYSMWAVMNAVHSDHGADIASMLRISPSETGNESYVKAVHKLATNMLADEDGVFSVRRYFLEG